jgi:hypothetical protein
MNRVLLAIGLLATAAGFVTIGFGIPINAFSLGNTLIVAGTIAVAAGLILMGLASAIGQLRRIAEALHTRPLPHLARPAESVEALVPPTARITPAPPPPPRMPPPPRPPEMRQPAPLYPRAAEPHAAEPRVTEPHAAEPRFAAPTPPSEPPGPLDWLRAKPRPSASAAQAGPIASATPESAMVEVPDEAPLSPRPLQRPSMAPPPEATQEPKVWSQGRTSTESQPMAEPMPRAMPVAEPPKAKNGGPFDLVWPEHPAAPASESDKREANLEMPAPPPPFVLRPREERAPEKRGDVPPKPAERVPAILKSGVIDGMPYTLYADGSIEAELPQGTLRFASVDALRAHLEKHG